MATCVDVRVCVAYQKAWRGPAPLKRNPLCRMASSPSDWWKVKVREAEKENTPQNRRWYIVTAVLMFGSMGLFLLLESLVPFLVALLVGVALEVRLGKAWYIGRLVDRTEEPVRYWVGVAGLAVPLGLLIYFYAWVYVNAA